MRRKLTETLVANKGTVVAGVVVVVLALVASSLVGLDPPFVIALLVPFGVVTRGVYRWRSRSPGSRPARAPAGKLAWSGLAALIAVFLLAQAVPYGRDHSNPQITGQPDWNTPLTRELVVRACFDCHSNEVDWPWYSSIAPISWATWKHVEDGRDAVNYQEWDRPRTKPRNRWPKSRRARCRLATAPLAGSTAGRT